MDDNRLKFFRDTIENEYDTSRFLQFLSELLHDIKPFEHDIIEPADDSLGIESCYYHGDYIDSGGKKIMLLSICVKNLNARTTQRNFVRKLIHENRLDGALAAFYSSENPDKWRFSLVRFVKQYVSSIKTRETITPARRYSYLVGKGEPSHTAQERLFPIFENESHKPALDELEEAFRVEPVADEFYEHYEEKYVELLNILAADKKFTLNPEHFAKKLLGQIAFLYFLQKKGWLGVRQGCEWGTGQRNFMRQIFTDCTRSGENFFNDYLEPLFYDALNNDRGGDYYFPVLDCRIPFLNGGLFEAKYKWREKLFTIKNSFFSNANKDGVLDIFDRYNFTISEDEPFDSEIAIDPEMLGRVFESLLERQQRKKIGAFYTPREIVHYMCQECLVEYIANKTGIADSEIRKFMTLGDILPRDEIDAKILERLDEIDELLKNIKVVDIAAGSGAFLLGILNEIVHARNIITSFTPCNDERAVYTLKHDTIRDAIFACDIEPAAVDIAKLRLWLSLVIDDETSQPKPLPNLDCNIICADSLLESFMGIKLTSETKNQGLIFGEGQDDKDMINELKALQRKLYDESSMKKKEALREGIKRIQDAVITRQIHLEQNTETQKIIDAYNKVKDSDSKPFVLWQMTFPRVFEDNNGFDIVIGNPPYVSTQKIPSEYRKIISSTFKTCVKHTDLYIAFIERGCSLLAREGILSFIIPYSYTNQNSAQASREMLIDDCAIDEIVDTSNYFVFKSADVKNIILRVSKRPNQHRTRIRRAETRREFEAEEFYEFTIDQEVFRLFSATRFRVNDFRNGISTKVKIDSEAVNFGDICLVSLGIEAHKLKDKTRRKSYYLRANYEEGLKPFIEGKNIQRYHHEQLCWLKYTPSEHHCPMFPELFENEKIMFIRIVSKGNRIRFSYDDKNLYNSETVTNCVRIDKLRSATHSTAKSVCKGCKSFDFVAQYDMKFLLGILNSKLINWYFMTFISEGLHINPSDAEQLPIIDLRKRKVNQPQIISLVNQVIEAKSHGQDSQEQESQIDRLVYELYGLTDSEIALIEGAAR